MAALIGVAYPVNSVGVLPLAHLDQNTPLYSSMALYANAKQVFSIISRMFINNLQVLAQYLAKANFRQQTTLELLYKPFHPLENHTTLVSTIGSYIQDNQFQKANEIAYQLIDLSLRGLHYYQVYPFCSIFRPYLLSPK